MPRRISLLGNTLPRQEDVTVGRPDDFGGINNTIPSITIAPHEFRNIMASSERSDMTIREMMEDSTATGLVLKANEPWRDAHLKLHYDFLESLQAHVSKLQIFDTVATFIQNCTDTLELMRGMKAKVETSELSPEEISLENERNTWRLVYCLYQNRLDSTDGETHMETDNKRRMSEKEVIQALYKSSKLIREYQLIIDWLEKNACDQADRLPSIENFTDRTVAWENTLHQLQNKKSGIAFPSSRPIVSSMDPDAPIREGKPLHDLDKEDDARLEKRMLIEVRCGRMQKAQALAIHCGQHWRAACLLGWAPYHDPNYKSNNTEEKLPVEGNPNRSLWKYCAWQMSNDARVGQYYRAIYSSLCGNVKQLLTIANSWQDGLWAYMKTLLDIKVEAEVRGFMPKSYIALPEDYWKGENTLEDIFDELEASANPVIASQAKEPAHRIQKYLILDEITTLIDDAENMIEQKTCDAQFLRFLAHLVLFFRQIGKNLNEQAADKILLEYVKLLMEMGDPLLIAFYTATLPRESQTANYAHFLERVTEYEERKKCLNAAEDANLNVEAITKLVVENIRQKNLELQSQDLSSQLTDADLEKINALDWLTFYPSQREEALWQTNALIRYFLTNEKLDAARKAFNKIPVDAIETVINEFPALHNTIENLMTTNLLPKKISASIREYLCYKSYLDAQEGFSEWFSHFYHARPSPVEELPPYATFTEKVAYEHKTSQYNTEMERWKTTMQHHTKAVKQLLFNVLLFPDGGWLVDSANVSNNEPLTSEEILREHQLEKLRKLCIPKIALLLHTVMTEMNEQAECVQLADILASEQHQLYKVFSKDRMQEIFKKICESSLALMDQKKDPWGYSK
ncbi:nuclear pore complex protein Nup107 [Nasonia vitripennis]|uniref:Nuclear pore complex protein n=1 Tax=Nasonia vitripennis TaxID=7425 RepID=A0A7M7G4T7_NASVI|nr:nuclear pore complex protein Nup107 [Nasonia vitripennis]XP_008202397.1 nuclear pore complex protein Nup107 [Nasonia vitripennis]XP_008202398.1 nuclear pore complex protein Nup107 [Nasonia vitripennis]